MGLRNLCQLLVYLPLSADVKEFNRKNENMLAERQKHGTSEKDIFRHLLGEDSETGTVFTQAQLGTNATLTIIGGTDTTSSTLTQMFWKLAQIPES
jgi:cytochrome P450